MAYKMNLIYIPGSLASTKNGWAMQTPRTGLTQRRNDATKAADNRELSGNLPSDLEGHVLSTLRTLRETLFPGK